MRRGLAGAESPANTVFGDCPSSGRLTGLVGLTGLEAVESDRLEICAEAEVG